MIDSVHNPKAGKDLEDRGKRWRMYLECTGVTSKIRAKMLN